MNLMRALVKSGSRRSTTSIGRRTAKPRRSVASTRPSTVRIIRRKKLW